MKAVKTDGADDVGSGLLRVEIGHIECVRDLVGSAV